MDSYVVRSTLKCNAEISPLLLLFFSFLHHESLHLLLDMSITNALIREASESTVCAGKTFKNVDKLGWKPYCCLTKLSHWRDKQACL